MTRRPATPKAVPSPVDDAIVRDLAQKFALPDQQTCWQFVLYGGIGDHVLWLSLLVSFRQRATCPLLVYCDRRVADLARLYAGRAYDRLIELDALSEREIAGLHAVARFAPGHPLLAWHCHYVGDELRYLADRDLSIADLIRQLLRLPSETPLDPPDWPLTAQLVAANHMRRLGLPVGRTVLLAPWAKTARATLPDPWWIDLAGRFAARGFTIATNVGNRARGFDQRGLDVFLQSLPDSIAADISLADLGPFAERCGTVVCARSGLSDLLAFSKARMCVVWPHAAALELYHRKYFAVWSVQRIYQRSNIIELHPDIALPLDQAVLPDWQPTD